MKNLILIVMTIGILGACSTPVQYTQAPMNAYDKDTDYVVEDKPDGFDISLIYSRYQFITESSLVAATCKSALTSIAYEIADKRGRKIENINEQRIRLSMGRSEISGLTTCSANAVVKWAK